MKTKEIRFTKENISDFSKVTKDYAEEILLSIGSESDDIVKGLLTLRIDAYILSNMAEERILIYYCDRPSFFDWLFRRKKEVKWDLKVKDLLLNPPELKDRTQRIYTVNKIDN